MSDPVYDQKPEDLSSVTQRDVNPVLDHGYQAWAQIFGAFWLWFNTW